MDKDVFSEIQNSYSSPSPATKPAEPYEQKIFYGVPGSGKSYKIDNEKTKGASEYQKQKVVFHPDYTNSDFIGQIIPKMKEIGEGENKQSRIEYSFKPGPFTTILRRALRDKEHQYYLIIEEINRGNAAAIFGDLFQLLDRSDDGWSCSPINNDDINYYVASEYEFWDDRYSDSHEYNAENVNHSDSTEPFGRNSALRLPPNLSIYATMNTNDQNVFTLDNAFNRRFLSEYISNRADSSIKEHCNQHNLKIGESEILWGNFRNQINKRIVESGFSNAEDKQLGLFFIKKSKNSDGISSRDFSDKVLKYLWHDVFKRDRDIFSGKSENLKFEDLIDNFIGSDAFEKCFDEKFVSELKSNNSELKQDSEIDAEKSST
ncbi:MAG: AAA family ATPase [Treponema sp.]|nr:AAA family ATPase [Treponema sp.]